MKALLIKVEFSSGQRAGGINPRSKKLRCDPSWQDLKGGWEIRCTDDDAEIEKYRGVAGVTVLEDEAAIQAQLASFPPKVLYKVISEPLMALSLQQVNPDLSALSQDATHEETLAFLHAAGVKGIRRITREVASPNRVMTKDPAALG